MMYMVFSAAGTMDTARYSHPDDAVARAKQKAKHDGVDYKVYKLVETYYIKAPVMPEPVVEALDGVVD